jgi:hypothetical protein
MNEEVTMIIMKKEAIHKLQRDQRRMDWLERNHDVIAMDVLDNGLNVWEITAAGRTVRIGEHTIRSCIDSMSQQYDEGWDLVGSEVEL